MDWNDDDRLLFWGKLDAPFTPRHRKLNPSPTSPIVAGRSTETPADTKLSGNTSTFSAGREDTAKSTHAPSARPAAAKNKLPPIIKPSSIPCELPRQFVNCGILDRQRQVFAAMISHLQDVNVGYFTGGSGRAGVRRINVRRDDSALVVGMICAVRSSYEFYVQLASEVILTIDEFSNSGMQWPTSFTLLVLERSCIAGGFNQIHASRIQIAIWELAETYSADRQFQTDLSHRSFSRIRERTFLRMLSTREDSDREDAGDIYSCDFPVDVVYTWVNDQDVAWQRRKDRTSVKHHRQANAGARAMLSERFRNRDELRFSFRSLEMFAPFVRRIFLVTDDQTPYWLDTSHPKVEVVSHREIFRDRSWLPSFNSSGIETQLHHIAGLSEHFLYFNDDFFLGDMVRPEDFFLANGALRCFPSDQFANEKDIDEEREEYVVADKNAIALFQADFGMVGRNIMQHVPYPSSKSLLMEIEARYQRHFDICARNPFRSMRDLRPIAFMQYHYGFRQRRIVPSKISHRYLALWKPTILKQLENVLRFRSHKTFCINDVGVSPDRESQIDEAISNFLEAYYPFKSSFEK